MSSSLQFVLDWIASMRDSKASRAGLIVRTKILADALAFSLRRHEGHGDCRTVNGVRDILAGRSATRVENERRSV